MKYLIILLLSLVSFNSFAFDPFSLKGKFVVFSPDDSNEQYKNIYNSKTIKGKGFEDKNRLDIEIYGKKVFVEDVVLNEKKQDRPFLYFVCNIEDQKFTLLYNLYSYGIGNGYLSHPNENPRKIENGMMDMARIYHDVYVYKPTDLSIDVYEIEYLDSLKKELGKNKKYAIKQFGGWYLDGKDINTFGGDNTTRGKHYVSSLGKPLTFVEFIYAFPFGSFNKSGNIQLNNVWYDNVSTRKPGQTLSAVYTDGKDKFCLYLDAALDTNVLVNEEKYLELSMKQYEGLGVESCIGKYKNTEIHFKIKDDYFVGKGYYLENGKNISGVRINENNTYLLDDITLRQSLNPDDIFYQYYISLTGTSENIKGVKYYIPFLKNWENLIESASDYRAEVERKAQEANAQQLENERRWAKEEADYKAELIRKYGRANANLILDGQVKIGFTKAMCEESWGSPSSINRTTTAYGTLEQWVYGIGCYLYFEGNKLTAIQN